MTGEGKKRAAVFSVVLLVAATGSAANDGFDPFVPVVYRSAGLAPTLETLRQVRATTSRWIPSVRFGQMEPEFLFIRKGS